MASSIRIQNIERAKLDLKMARKIELSTFCGMYSYRAAVLQNGSELEYSQESRIFSTDFRIGHCHRELAKSFRTRKVKVEHQHHLGHSHSVIVELSYTVNF